jgi:hypothetical protein
VTGFLDQFDATPTGPPQRERRDGDFLSEFDATPAAPEKPKAAPKGAAAAAGVNIHALGTKPGEPDPYDQVARSIVQSTGAGIVAGWRGMATLATGGTLDDAADNVNEELEHRGYRPESETTARVMASPWNPLNWFGVAAKKAGEVSQDLGAPPSVATGVETAINAAPLLLMRKGNEPLRSPVKMENLTAAESAERVADGRVATAAAEGPTPIALPIEEQARRAEVLQRVGIEEGRKSALTGSSKEAATDFQQSKLDNQAGNYMRAKLDQERAALTQHAESIVQDTGGTVGSDSTTAYARGGSILEPLDKLSEYFDRQIKSLYKEADARSEGVKIDMPKVRELMAGDQAEFLGTTEGEALLKGVKARMKTLGMAGEGEGEGITVGQAERLKQYLNNVWQPRTSRLIRGLREAIDDDVMQSAGEDVYGQARALRRMRAVTLDEPNGIGKLLDAEGPEKINRAVPVEKVADTIAGMPVDQLAHVVRTLRAVPEELQPQAQTALSEIRAHFANKMLEAGTQRVGQWGARDVSRYIRNNQARLEMVFSPEELAKMGDLEEAGRILRLDQSYPGAAVQEHNLVARGAMAAVRAGAAATGGAAGALVGAPGAGAAVGELVGAKLTSKFSEGAALRAAQKRFVRLSEIAK